MIGRAEYFAARDALLSDLPAVEAMEKRYQEVLVQVLTDDANLFKHDFDAAGELRPFWLNYPQVQRGRGAIGDGCPWGDLGEHTILPRVLLGMRDRLAAVGFAGIPSGADLRFLTDDAFLHIDVKLTGPRDNPDEVVVPPQQVSGDGALWNDEGGFHNTPVQIVGQRASMMFYPNLPPFYVIDGKVKVCLSYFVEVVYDVRDFGDQPLLHLEAICVPNGLLMWEGPKYGQTPLLFIPGKDDKTTPDLRRRARIRLDPLASIGSWRCVKVKSHSEDWTVEERRAVYQTAMRSRSRR